MEVNTTFKSQKSNISLLWKFPWKSVLNLLAYFLWTHTSFLKKKSWKKGFTTSLGGPMVPVPLWLMSILEKNLSLSFKHNCNLLPLGFTKRQSYENLYETFLRICLQVGNYTRHDFSWKLVEWQNGIRRFA